MPPPDLWNWHYPFAVFGVFQILLHLGTENYDSLCFLGSFYFNWGGKWPELGSWIWSSLCLQNSFPPMTINSRSRCFLSSRLCHHLLLLCFPEPCIAQISSFPNISSLSLCQHSYGSSLSVNLQVSLLCFFISMVLPNMGAHFGGCVFGPWSHQRPCGGQPLFPQLQFSHF